MIRSYASVVLVSTALATALGVSACGPSKPPVMLAHVQAGSLPAGATFRGVWFNSVWGELHLVPNGNDVVGKWKSEQNGVWGRLTGHIDGDLIKFDWVEHKTGAIGPGSTRSGKGYFKYVPAEGENALPKLKGEWGNDESEIGGGGWDCNLERDRVPDLRTIKGDEDPSIDSGWDTPAGGPKK